MPPVRSRLPTVKSANGPVPKPSAIGRGLVLSLHAVLPAIWVFQAGDAALGASDIDLLGHIWTIWHATRESLTQTHLVGFPSGIDLLPILGGWADIFLASILVPFVGLIPAFNIVTALYLTVTGIGIHVLCRCFGAGTAGAFLAGTLFQLEPFVLHNLVGGRTEQLGIGFVINHARER